MTLTHPGVRPIDSPLRRQRAGRTRAELEAENARLRAALAVVTAGSGDGEGVPPAWAYALTSPQDRDHQGIATGDGWVSVLSRTRPASPDPGRAWRRRQAFIARTDNGAL